MCVCLIYSKYNCFLASEIHNIFDHGNQTTKPEVTLSLQLLTLQSFGREFWAQIQQRSQPEGSKQYDEVKRVTIYWSN